MSLAIGVIPRWRAGGAAASVRMQLSATTMRMTKQQLTEHTIAVWRPRLGRRLSSEDAREITENITGFFTVLTEWSRREGRDGSDMNARGGATHERRDPCPCPWGTPNR